MPDRVPAAAAQVPQPAPPPVPQLPDPPLGGPWHVPHVPDGVQAATAEVPQPVPEPGAQIGRTQCRTVPPPLLVASSIRGLGSEGGQLRTHSRSFARVELLSHTIHPPSGRRRRPKTQPIRPVAGPQPAFVDPEAAPPSIGYRPRSRVSHLRARDARRSIMTGRDGSCDGLQLDRQEEPRHDLGLAPLVHERRCEVRVRGLRVRRADP